MTESAHQPSSKEQERQARYAEIDQRIEQGRDILRPYQALSMLIDLAEAFQAKGDNSAIVELGIDDTGSHYGVLRWAQESVVNNVTRSEGVRVGVTPGGKTDVITVDCMATGESVSENEKPRNGGWRRLTQTKVSLGNNVSGVIAALREQVRKAKDSSTPSFDFRSGNNGPFQGSDQLLRSKQIFPQQ